MAPPALHPFVHAILVNFLKEEARRRRKEGQKSDKENLFARSRMQSCLKSDHCKQNIFKQPLRSHIFIRLFVVGKRSKSHPAESNIEHGAIP